MSISSSGTRKAGPYTGNGGTKAFPFAFKVFQASDVLVVQTDTTPTDHTLAYNTDYTVTLNPNQDANPGGTVNIVVAPPSGYLLTIGSNVPELQSVTLTNNGGFYPSVINAALDYVTILIQQLSEKVGRALVMPFSTNASGQLPPVAPGQLLGWKADGTGIDNVGASGVGAGGIVASNMASGATGTALSADTQAAAAKAPPADADSMPLFDSAVTYSLKKLTWANLKAALKSVFDARYVLSGADGSSADIVVIGTATALTAAAHSGKTIYSTAGVYLTIPVVSGFKCRIYGNPAGLTLAAQSGLIYTADGSYSASIVVDASYLAAIELVSDGTNVRANAVGGVVQTTTNDPGYASNSNKPASTGWVRGAMIAIAAAAGATFSPGLPGYIKFPNWVGGFIIQWGGPYTVPASGGYVAVPFVIGFPNAALVPMVSVVGGAAQMLGWSGLTKSGMNILTGASDTSSRTAYYIVVGY